VEFLFKSDSLSGYPRDVGVISFTMVDFMITGYIYKYVFKFQSESKSRMREARQRCCVAAWGREWRGVHSGHFQVPCGMVVRGGKRQSTDDMPSSVIYVTKEHLMFLKQTLTYLAVSIILGRGEQGCIREGGRRWYRGSRLARVGLY